jgi:hypothetical protein
MVTWPFDIIPYLRCTWTLELTPDITVNNKGFHVCGHSNGKPCPGETSHLTWLGSDFPSCEVVRLPKRERKPR